MAFHIVPGVKLWRAQICFTAASSQGILQPSSCNIILSVIEKNGVIGRSVILALRLIVSNACWRNV